MAVGARARSCADTPRLSAGSASGRRRFESPEDDVLAARVVQERLAVELQADLSRHRVGLDIGVRTL
jgi:hypothetical protein